MLEASEGVWEQQGLVRGPLAPAGKLTDAVEPVEQGLAVERYHGRWPIEGWLRNRAKIRLGSAGGLQLRLQAKQELARSSPAADCCRGSHPRVGLASAGSARAGQLCREARIVIATRMLMSG